MTLLKKNTHLHFLQCLFMTHLLKKQILQLIYDRIDKKKDCTKYMANDEILVTNQ